MQHITIQNLPTHPGCYLFKNTNGQILYVGKAKNLKKRVKSYFQKNIPDPKTQQMMSQIDSVDYLVTDTEVESFILENILIKKHQPKYNIRMKDAKSFAYIHLTDEQFPRIGIARRKTRHGSFYGPFVSAAERDYILRFLQKTFLLRTCRRMPKKPCLRYHIGLCSAPCAGGISAEEYQQNIKQVKQVLSGNTHEVIKDLNTQIKKHAAELAYEQALTRRNQRDALIHLNERQNMQRQRRYNEDIINYLIRDNTVYLMLFNIYKGTLSQKHEYIFQLHNDFLEEFLVQYYSDNPIPKELIIPEPVSDTLILFLKQKKQQKVQVTIPQRGAKKQLLELVHKNIEHAYFGDHVKVELLGKRLKLPQPPSVIECFDISHLSGTSTAGSMVQFRNGRPDKSNYRRFRIRTIEGVDDFAAIAEVVHRRYKRLLEEDAELPDLIIIDGGRGQLSSALQQLKQLGVKIPVVALAKQFEEIYLPGQAQPLRLFRKDEALRFLQEIRDEAHRFALKYNRLLRKKEMIA